jgi:ubiquinone/menaquinone biosynthesis C-methylase UbiE
MSFLFKRIADNTDNKSLSHEYRYKRFQFFISLINSLPKPLKILDIGGTQKYWDNMNFDNKDVEITLLNLETQPCTKVNFKSVIGNATNLSQYPDKSFDIIYSNSCIEHLFTWENQKKMANEVMRVGKRYFIQTPNRYFPIEPHFLFPLFQFLPYFLKVFLINNFTLGHIKKKGNREEAEQQIQEIRLLSKKDMKLLFPDGNIWEEKIGGMIKSFVSYKF